MANTFRQYLQAETIILQVDLIVCFRNLQKRTDDAVSLFGDKEAGGICVLKGYKEYYYGYDGKAVYVDLIDELQSKYPLTEPQIIGESAQKAFIGLFGAILRAIYFRRSTILRATKFFPSAKCRIIKDDITICTTSGAIAERNTKRKI